MIIVYKCDFCGKEFTNEYLCRMHELYHTKKIKEIKNQLIRDNKIELCNYCANGYYAYGCEFNCEHVTECNSRNNYKDFIPVNPLHDRYKNGGV